MSSLYRYLDTLEEQEKRTLEIISTSAITCIEDHKYYLGRLEAYRESIEILKAEFKEQLINRTTRGVFNATFYPDGPAIGSQ